MRVYLAPPLTLGEHQLPAEKAHHLVKVLRLKEGAPLEVFDGEGKVAEATLTRASTRACHLLLHKLIDDLPPENALPIHLAQVLAKGQRMDLIMQKATELGAHSITPLTSEYCDVSKSAGEKRTAHFQQILISASEQCRRRYLPVLHPTQSLHEFLHAVAPTQGELRLTMQPGAQPLHTLITCANKPSRVLLLVGPEGGFSDDEIAAAEVAEFAQAGLGPRVLRAETAPLAALTILQWCWGDFAAN